MLKILGCLLLFLAVSAIGFLFAEKLSKRVKYLKSLKHFSLSCSDEMRYNGKKLFNILSDYKDDNLHFLSKISRENILLKDELELLLKDYINDSDVDVLVEFFKKLGNSDIEGQKTHCAYYFELFGSMLEEAQKELDEKGKLYKTLSVFGGLALLILII